MPTVTDKAPELTDHEKRRIEEELSLARELARELNFFWQDIDGVGPDELLHALEHGTCQEEHEHLTHLLVNFIRRMAEIAEERHPDCGISKPIAWE